MHACTQARRMQTSVPRELRSAQFYSPCRTRACAGTSLKYKPGVIVGGAGVFHDCGLVRSVGWFLEPLITLALFGKKVGCSGPVGACTCASTLCRGCVRLCTRPCRCGRLPAWAAQRATLDAPSTPSTHHPTQHTPSARAAAVHHAQGPDQRTPGPQRGRHPHGHAAAAQAAGDRGQWAGAQGDG